MILTQPLFSGKLIKRYKRFLADVMLDSGEVVTAHSANTGAMTGCAIPGSPVLLSKSDNPKRKLAYTWELVYVNETWVCINTALPNKLGEEAVKNGRIPSLQGYPIIRREVKYHERSRIDLLLEKEAERCYVEIKNVTLVENQIALFPDAVTLRGQKHLQDLMAMVKAGHRSVLLFVVNRQDATVFSPAEKIDPVYAALLREAANAGVEVLAYQSAIDPPEIFLDRKLPIEL